VSPSGVARSQDVVLSIDIGGTKISSAVVGKSGNLTGFSVLPAPNTREPREYLDAVLSCSDRSLTLVGYSRREVIGVGCGCPGPMVWPEGRVTPVNIVAWEDFPLAEQLRQEFPGCCVRVHNDGVAMAVGEHWMGAGKGASNMLAITVSTGIGGGLILGNKLHNGKSGNAGHIGHILVDQDGPQCRCGSKGCLEAIASGPRTVEWALSRGWVAPRNGNANGKTLAESASLGDDIARHALARAGDAVGTALSICASLLDLQLAVVSGGFSHAGEYFWGALRGSFFRRTKLDFARKMSIVHRPQSNIAALLGGAAFVFEGEEYGFSDTSQSGGPRTRIDPLT
jgi:glucokinase